MAKVRVEFLQTCVTREGKFRVGSEAFIDEAEFKRLGETVCRPLPNEPETDREPKSEGAPAETEQKTESADATADQENVTPKNKAGKPGKKK